MARCETRADATWHTRPRGSATQTHASACMARTRGRATRVHADTSVAPTWHKSDGLANDGPIGIVGPGYSIGAVTHLR